MHEIVSNDMHEDIHLQYHILLYRDFQGMGNYYIKGSECRSHLGFLLISRTSTRKEKLPSKTTWGLCHKA